MKYFKGFWNKLEFALLCFCVSVIAMYALKHILTTLAMNALKDPDKGKSTLPVLHVLRLYFFYFISHRILKYIEISIVILKFYFRRYKVK